MSDIVQIIRAVVQEELKQLRLGDIGVVMSVFPHKKDDENNYECNVKLREGDLELRKTPIATPHIGMVSAPNVGDLVLVSYVGGDPNRPIVVGRLYSDKSNPPEHEDQGWLVRSPSQEEGEKETSLAIDKEAAIHFTAGKNKITLNKDKEIEVTGETDLKIVVKGNVSVTCKEAGVEAEEKVSVKCKEASVEAEETVSVKCKDCLIDASGKIDLGAGGAGVITEESHKCYFTGAPLVASKNVKAKL